MELVINNKKITTPILEIVEQVKRECPWDVFRTIQDRKEYIRVTCPFHSDGHEKHPSCSIYASYANEDISPGVCHCFTCGTKLPIYAWIARCFGEDEEWGKEWLIERFANIFVERQEILPEIILDKPQKSYLPESYLNKYAYIHPYLLHRNISVEVMNRFKIGYDFDTNSVTFPLRDIKGNLLGVSERSVSTKYFYIPQDIEKPVYLLDEVIRRGYTSTIICESQIDALTCFSYGYVACAMIGTGGDEQYKILNSSPIRHYVLMFDGDPAGRNGAKKFTNNIRDDVIVDIITLPEGKDINDLNKEQFEQILRQYNVLNCLRDKSCI